MPTLHGVPLFVLGKPQLRVLKHPTFGCLMEWYNKITESGIPVNPVALDLMQRVHSLARENTHRVRYTETVEALYTAKAPPEVLEGVLNAGVGVKFVSPTQQTIDAYDAEEMRASFYGTFENSVVTAWTGAAAKKPSWFGIEIPAGAPRCHK